MLSSPIDAQTVLQSAYADDPVQKKLAVDSLKKRLGDSRTEDQKLQEACEGFESIFIQKMWEQMRKNVPKEGYLHSKDEETYQSMFDTELARKMTEAGGIGLAEMLREQLSQKLSDASRGSVSGNSREPIPLATTREALEAARARDLVAKDLYSAIAEEPAAEDPQPVAADPEAVLRKALAEMQNEYETGMSPESMAAALNGPLMGRLPHYVAPGAEPRIVAAGPDAASHLASRPGRVSAPGKGAPSGRRTAQRNFETAAETAAPGAPARGPQAHPAAVAVQVQLAAQAENGPENGAENGTGSAAHASRNAASTNPLFVGQGMTDAPMPGVPGDTVVPGDTGEPGQTGAFVPPDGTAAVRTGHTGQSATHVRGPQPLNAWGGVEEALQNAASAGVDLRT